MSALTRRTALGAALLLAGSSGCFHATSVAKPDEEKKDDAAASTAQPKESEGGAAAQAHLARRPQEPGRPPLAAGPGGLFVPGGVERLQKALAGKGYLNLDETQPGQIDAATSAAVRLFQSKEGIARTGNPDHETVRKLGLDPDELFRKSEVAKDSK